MLSSRLLDASVKSDWVVYAKPPFGGPEQVLKYLSRYTHRIAISNRRLVAMDDQTVTFKYKDYAHNNRPRVMTLEGDEFLRRFLLHAVPRGFVRMRHFGILANCVRTQYLIDCRRLLAVPATKPQEDSSAFSAQARPNLHVLRRGPRPVACERPRAVSTGATPRPTGFLLMHVPRPPILAIVQMTPPRRQRAS